MDRTLFVHTEKKGKTGKNRIELTRGFPVKKVNPGDVSTSIVAAAPHSGRNDRDIVCHPGVSSVYPRTILLNTPVQTDFAKAASLRSWFKFHTGHAATVTRLPCHLERKPTLFCGLESRGLFVTGRDPRSFQKLRGSVKAYGRSSPSILGNGMVSRTWDKPQIQETVRSNPRPNPEWGTEP